MRDETDASLRRTSNMLLVVGTLLLFGHLSPSCEVSQRSMLAAGILSVAAVGVSLARPAGTRGKMSHVAWAVALLLLHALLAH